MLTRIKVKSLFNIYDYDIDLTNHDGSMVKFITAPNGYGKTTILDFIESAIKQSYVKFFMIPFKVFELYYDEADSDYLYKYSVSREDETTSASDTDLTQTLSKKLIVRLHRINESDEILIEQFFVEQTPDGTFNIEGSDDNIKMFFVSHSCFYLDDKRMLRRKTDVKDDKLRLEDLPITQYPKEMKTILEVPTKSQECESCINAFRDILNRCEFANKHLEIDKRFGFRFVADDELHTILTLEQLSSGEKQMINQVYELLFRAQSGTLVMIDEPELSLHMMWQMNYLKNLSEIANLRGFQCIVATHSPQIFNSLWSKSVDLFTLSNQE